MRVWSWKSFPTSSCARNPELHDLDVPELKVNSWLVGGWFTEIIISVLLGGRRLQLCQGKRTVSKVAKVRKPHTILIEEICGNSRNATTPPAKIVAELWRAMTVWHPVAKSTDSVTNTGNRWAIMRGGRYDKQPWTTRWFMSINGEEMCDNW